MNLSHKISSRTNIPKMTKNSAIPKTYISARTIALIDFQSVRTFSDNKSILDYINTFIKTLLYTMKWD